MKETIEVYTGESVTIEHLEALPGGGARFELTTDDGRKWHVDVTRGGETEIVTSWRDGVLADLDEPEWLGDVASRLARS